MEQQEQTQKYFNISAQNWQSQAAGKEAEYNVIVGRSRVVLDIIAKHSNAKRFLDVGCGTGQLAIDVAKLGIVSEGNDFADEMVAQCRENARTAGVSASFKNGSFFDNQFEGNAYDVISAQGFIEYISTKQLDLFLERCANMLRSGGVIALGSRNRLFNAVSLNSFTKLEMDLGVIGNLLSESIIFQTSKSQEEALQSIQRLERIEPQPDRHPITGILVDTRYQFSPAELIYRMRKVGFVPSAVYPVHYHSVPLSFANERPDIHTDLANTIEEVAFGDQRFVPFSSTFIIEAVLDK